MNNYPKIPFTEIATLIRGVSYDKSVALLAAKDGFIPILRANNIQKNLVLNDLVYVPNDFVKEEQMIRKGDIILAMSSGSKDLVGKSAQANNDIDAAFGTFCGLIRAKENIDSKYLGLFFQTQEYRNFVSYQSKGVNICNLKKKDIESLQIPLPPLPTQHAIVTRIETLFAELDKAVQHLRTAQQQIKTYRQAVLNHWLNNDEGKWKMVKLGEVAEMCLGKMLDKNKNKGTYQPYLRNVNVRWGSFDLDDLLEMRFEESEQDRYGIQKGDLIMCEGGEPGRCAIWKSDIHNMKIQKALHRIRLNSSVLNKYVYFLFVLYAQNGKLEKYFTGTTIKHLTGQSLKMVEIPLPPLTEQQRIVKEIESRLSQATASETYIENALQQAEALRQSILKKAFSGELV
ncbi:MAG: restriction endonuclease subunit S [Bacteroidales bacterium]|nr:restriction endonuclease subunit S [Bacteroidales bacterium]